MPSLFKSKFILLPDPQSGRWGVVVCKEGHIYSVECDAHGLDRALQVVGRWACNGDLNFGWFEAAVVAARLRGMMVDAKCEGR